MEKHHYSVLFTIIGFLHLGYGCSIEGIETWFVPITINILDTYRGVLFSGASQNIQAVTGVIQREGLKRGPYVDVFLDNSLFNVTTNSTFENYEDIETETTLSYTITLRCTDGALRNLVVIINVTDTNNNDPIFLPNNKYEFSIAPPVPPGFVVTTCLKDILVKDIDLTTQRINFKIEGSSLFEISFDPSSKVEKEFKAILKTTNLIRSIAEPIKLTVTATDVDLTGDPPRSATASVVITADSQFQFPDEPIFSEPFYLANYIDNDVILQQSISLRQGYDNKVKFTFESDHFEYFELVVQENKLTFKMKAPLPLTLYEEMQIYLVVKATREHTSGASATVILKLPEDTPLEFEKAKYDGTITDNVLKLTDLKLKQGYEGHKITVDIKSVYAFKANIDMNVIKISMDPLPTDVIKNNNFIDLQVIASNNRTTALTVVVLEILKDDYTTPVFESNFYSGSYSTENGLTLEPIILTQGFDDTIKIILEGKHIKYFETKQDGPRITVTSSTIPLDIFNERNIMITVVAFKPRTVKANAAINIALPSARHLNFEKDVYEGTIENKNLNLNTIVLKDGYAPDVFFNLTGDFKSFFSIENEQNKVSIEIKKEIPESVLLENDILVFTLSATGMNTIATSTSIVLQVIKNDHRTPVFSDNLYSLKYENDELSVGTITFLQGFDETVTFELKGEHREYFAIERNLNNITLILNSSIPENIIFNAKIIILNIVAQKPRTVGANAAVYITFPQEMIEPTVMSFERNAYKGLLEGGNLTVDDIVLETGYTLQTKFVLSGEYAENFTINYINNVVKITPANNWSLEDLEEYNIIILEVKASRERAISASTVVIIDIFKTVLVPPVFEKTFYKGTYTSDKGLLFEEFMSLQKGFDETVQFSLEGEFSKWFILDQNKNSINLKVNTTSPILEEILEKNAYLFLTIIANKPGTIAGRSVIFINLPKENKDIKVVRFEQNSYVGRIEKQILHMENLRLLEENNVISSTEFNITGDYASYFTILKFSDFIRINLVEAAPEMIENNEFIVLNIEAYQLGAISGHTTILVKIVKEKVNIRKPIFSEIYYTGEYSKDTELLFTSPITLVEGYDETVKFELEDDDSKWFSLVHNVPNKVILKIKNDSINDVLDRSHLIFTVVANKIGSSSARAAIVISILEKNNVRILQFEQISYLGSLENSVLKLEDLRLFGGITSTMKFDIIGDYASYFSISNLTNSIRINLIKVPTAIIDNNEFIILNVKASEPNAVNGSTTIVLKIVKNQEHNTVTPVFSEAYYTGQYSKDQGLVFLSVITLIRGYDETVTFTLDNDDSKGFVLKKNGLNEFSLILDGTFKEPENRNYLLFTVIARKPNTIDGRAAIAISVADPSETNVTFDQILYNGKLDDDVLSHDKITLSGFNGANIQILGEYQALFRSQLTNGVVKIETSGADFPKDLTYIALELQAASATAVLLIDVSISEPPETDDVSFDRVLYNGKIDNGVLSHDKITLTGFNGANIQILGEHKVLFKSSLTNGVVKIETSGADFPKDLTYIALELQAASANAVLLIDVSLSDPPETDEISFDRVLYNGKINNGVLSHDKIIVSGFNGANIQILGEHKALFKSSLTNGIVKIETSGADFPKDLTYIALELQAASATAVLLMDVSLSEPPETDEVSFDRVLYNGKINNGVLSHDKITVSGFNGANIQILGEHKALFKSSLTNGIVKIETSGADFPKDLTYIALELQAASATAFLLMDVSLSEPPETDEVSFDRVLYNGKINNGVLSHDKIIVSGFNGANIQILGEHKALFKSSLTNGIVKIETSGADFPKDLTYIALELQAASATAVLLMDVSLSEPPETDEVSFDRVLYNGKINNGVLSHDKITVSGFNGANIQILGEHKALFKSSLTNGIVKIETSGADFPKDLTYIALELQAASATAFLLMDVSLSEPPETDEVSFDRVLYNGKINNGVLSHDKITVSGFNGANIQILGEHKALFKSSLTNGIVKIETSGADFPKDLTYIALELQAASATAVLLMDVSLSEPPETDEVSFDRVLYNGKINNGVLSHDKITVSGFNGANIQILGEHKALFKSSLTNGIVKIETSDADFPKDLTYIALELQAASATAFLLMDVSLSEPPETDEVSFDRVLYNGKINNGVLSHDKITVSGFNGANIQILGEHKALFKSSLTNGIVKIETSGADFPKDLTYIALELQAASATAVLLMDVSLSEPPETDEVSFDRVLYNGKINNGVLSHDKITVSGFNGANIQILGEHKALFKSSLTNGIVKIETSGADFPKDLTYIALELQAASATAVLLMDVSLSEPPETDEVSFDRVLYNGKINNGVLSHDKITVSGFNGANIQILGEHKALFKSSLTNGIVKIETSGADFPKDLTYIALELQAANANAVLLIDVSFSEPPETDDVYFDRNLYNGKLRNGVLSHDTIILSGFNGANIQILGEHRALFRSELTNGIVKIETSVLDFPKDLTYIALELQAASATAVLLIDVSFSETDDVSFDRNLYNGKLHDGVLSHDTITLSGFNGANIQILGEHKALFKSELTNGVVKIGTSVADFPKDLTYIALELQAASATAVLLIDVSYSENPERPIVSFKSESYFLWADEKQKGIIAIVEATANNGEDIIYSLSSINENIQSKIKINSKGEIILTAALDKGLYTFNAVATTAISQVQATAPVLLRVDTLSECTNEIGLSPLIILERLEEETHHNLVVLDQAHKGCRYRLSNVYPKDQSWLYVDKDGLHTRAIDREDESIAFMTLSQIQVELTLECDSDEIPAFTKRSLDTDSLDLYSYDGPNKWIQTDTISFDAKRSFVNLIVKDINDNSPIFLGKGNEPIYVGYPVSELENTVSPRALAELKATDADIGENAAIIYWSGEDNLAVSPNTGLVHVRNNAKLENNSRLTIYAIDQNGKGRNGTIDIVVKLLDINQIIILFVRDAFLEDEVDITNKLSKAVGYEIKVLKAAVTSNNNEELSRKKRDLVNNNRASLQLHVYGLLNREPVDINQLTSDINNSGLETVNIARIISLEDHLKNLEIHTAERRGLLAATIALAVILFIVLAAIAVWFFLKWKRSKNYEQFNDPNSSLSELTSPNLPKIEVVPKSRPNIEEIKKSEQRLQNMLDMPIDKELDPQVNVDVKAPIKILDDSIADNASSDAQLPIVIQSIDKLRDNTNINDDYDEFGEIIKPRKSMVTFNENVEKIIHIEDVPDNESTEDINEVYKF